MDNKFPILKIAKVFPVLARGGQAFLEMLKIREAWEL
jgi:hypothetical protein